VDDDRKTPVRIVVKKKRGHGGHHGGAWKVAYADFVTAMMALFIVLWIVGQSNSVKQAIAAYFKDPGVFSQGKGASGILDGGVSAEKGPAAVNRAIQESMKDAIREMEQLKAEGKKIVEVISATPAFEKFKDKVQVSVAEEGLRIELVEDASGLFFDIGSAQVKPETVTLLRMIASEIKQLPNSVILEGYTDARPYVSSGYSNWELSTQRANTARQILEQGGLKTNQIIEVRGFADRNLKHPDRPLDYSNRRVSILVAAANRASSDKDARTPPIVPSPVRATDYR
jgi:chemotaxis protein MotB